MWNKSQRVETSRKCFSSAGGPMCCEITLPWAKPDVCVQFKHILEHCQTVTWDRSLYKSARIWMNHTRLWRGGGCHTNIRSRTLWFNIFSLRIACKRTLWNSWLHFLLHWNTLFNSAYGPLLDFSFWLEYKRTPLLAHTKTPGPEGKRALWWFICTPNLRVIPHISKGHFILI